ncbi:hypothetical protein VMCG_05797 [Cytospora schulzeri]|uniref:Uncharacterized protein n=1 Tax=Cytospora schulzeri TaxID=448051 RepID=A0A423WI05_9PEZI|nr:hypothetical protein VMCG_05797 [Valsa malicola]
MNWDDSLSEVGARPRFMSTTMGRNLVGRLVRKADRRRVGGVSEPVSASAEAWVAVKKDEES